MKKLFSSQEIKFIIVFACIFIGSAVILTILGLIPSEFKVNGGETFEQKTQSAVRELIEGNNTDDIYANVSDEDNDIIYAENPVRLIIPSIDVDSVIFNPNSAKHEVLDGELTKGVVRYPGSGLPGSGNMFLFGHSTGFSVVQNKAFKVFNNLQKLKEGDTIIVHGTKGVYTYTVKTIRKVDKENALVKFDTQNNMITLSTCDSFGKASDRYVVEGDLVSVMKSDKS